MAPNGTVRVAGVDPFKDSLEGVTYLGTEWVLNPVVRRDIDVRCLLASVGGDYYPDRRDELVAILDIDLEWHMHEVSDGERRRVQLAMGLMRPWQVLLLDEVTVDLDLLARTRFLKFLKDESDARSCTIVYATHIFDLMNEWPTHLVHMTLGQVRHFGGFEELLNKHAARSEGLGSARIANLVLEWLSYDFEVRGPRKTLPKQ